MIAEPGILSTSPWNSDLLLKDLQSDFFRSCVSVNDVVDMGFPTMDIDNDSWMRNGRGDSKQAFGSSCSASSASSDCSDELNLEFDGSWCSSSCAAQIFPLVDQDYLNTSFSLLDDENFISVSSSPLPSLPSQSNGDEGDCNFDWVVGEDLVVTSIGSFCTEEERDGGDDDEEEEEEGDDSSSEDIFPSEMCTMPPKVNRTRPINDAVTSNKLWSKMVLSEQLEVVDALTNIVSNQMGLREQLDIIRIIEPSAVISPTDKEFVIDLNCLNDRKLCLVRDYVRRVQAMQEARQNKNGKQSCSSSKKSFSSGYSSPPVAASTSYERNVVTKVDANSSPVRGKGSKKEVKEKRPPQKAFRQRQKKEYKQLLKERRSGLFEHEEVLSLTTMPVSLEEEDDDIDILG